MKLEEYIETVLYSRCQFGVGLMTPDEGVDYYLRTGEIPPECDWMYDEENRELEIYDGIVTDCPDFDLEELAGLQITQLICDAIGIYEETV